MSNSPDPWPAARTENPYADTRLEPLRSSDPAPRVGMPTFAAAMFTASLIFSVLRIPLLGVSAWSLSRVYWLPYEITGPLIIAVTTGAAIVLFGISANVLLLMRKRAGIPLAWCLVASVFASIAFGIWQELLVWERFPQGSPPPLRMAFSIGFLVVRVTIFGMYIAAVMSYSKWRRSLEA